MPKFNANRVILEVNEKVKGQLHNEVLRILLNIVHHLKEASFVDTGWFRANHTVSNRPSKVVARNGEAQPDLPGIAKELSKIRSKYRFHLINNVPYAIDLMTGKQKKHGKPGDRRQTQRREDDDKRSNRSRTLQPWVESAIRRGLRD